MSAENVEVVRRVYQSFNASGLPDFRLLDPNIEWHTSDRALERGTYFGHSGVKAFLSSGNEVWTNANVQAEEFIDAGDCVVVPITLRTRGRTSGIQSEDRFFQVWKLRDNLIIELQVYSSHQEALEAVGLAEQDIPVDP
jgi:ketosteroid isomerase-like protein